MSGYKSRTITRSELLDGKNYGTHILDASIIGFNKVNCTTRNRSSWLDMFRFSDREQKKCIATVKVPIGATVIRSITHEKNRGYIINNSLRTDVYEILEIEPPRGEIESEKVVNATSEYDNTIEYEKGGIYHATLDKRENVCADGLYFFLDRESAEYDEELMSFNDVH